MTAYTFNSPVSLFIDGFRWPACEYNYDPCLKFLDLDGNIFEIDTCDLEASDKGVRLDFTTKAGNGMPNSRPSQVMEFEE